MSGAKGKWGTRQLKKNFPTSGSGSPSRRHVDCLDWSFSCVPSPSAPPSPGGVSPLLAFAAPDVFPPPDVSPPLVSAAPGVHALDALRFFGFFGFWVFWGFRFGFGGSNL